MESAYFISLVLLKGERNLCDLIPVLLWAFHHFFFSKGHAGHHYLTMCVCECVHVCEKDS